VPDGTHNKHFQKYIERAGHLNDVSPAVQIWIKDTIRSRSKEFMR